MYNGYVILVVLAFDYLIFIYKHSFFTIYL